MVPDVLLHIGKARRLHFLADQTRKQLFAAATLWIDRVCALVKLIDSISFLIIYLRPHRFSKLALFIHHFFPIQITFVKHFYLTSCQVSGFDG